MDYFPTEDSAAPFCRSVVGGAKGGADLMNVIGSPREKTNYTAPLDMGDDGNNDTLARELKKLRDIKTQDQESDWAGSGFPKTSN
jgi:hypothetical protein